MTDGPRYSAEEMMALYVDHGADIFSRSIGKWITSAGGLTDEKWSHENLVALLRERLGDVMLANVLCDVLVTSYDMDERQPFYMDERQPFYFKSWKAQGARLRGNETAAMRDFRLRDICRATSAAPTFFQPAEIFSRANTPRHLIDGGVFANNPAMCAYVSARKIYGHDEELIVASIGTGLTERKIAYEDAKDWGAVAWLRPVLYILMDGVEDAVKYQMAEVLGADRFFRFDTDLKRFGPRTDGPDIRTRRSTA